MISPVITFPALDISIENWNNDDILDIYIGDGLFSESEQVFNSRFLNHLVTDSTGHIFKIDGITALNTVKSILPFTAKYKMIFKPTGRIVTLDEFKNFIKAKINTLQDNSYKNDWLTQIENAETIREIIDGN